jgi:hypothetical protein
MMAVGHACGSGKDSAAGAANQDCEHVEHAASRQQNQAQQDRLISRHVESKHPQPVPAAAHHG